MTIWIEDTLKTLSHALLEISEKCPPYDGGEPDFERGDDPDEYWQIMSQISDARIGNIARDALAKIGGEA